ncbi:MAG: OmpA family protein, partial [Pseudomonadota bacterium]
ALPAARVTDNISLAPPPAPRATPLSIALLGDEMGVSLMGHVGSDTAHRALLSSAEQAQLGSVARPLTDLTEREEGDVPSTWPDSLRFGVEALALVGQGRIDLTPQSAVISARLPNATDPQSLSAELAALAPKHLDLTFDLTVAPPVIAPFVFALEMGEGRAVVEACACPSEEDKARIRTVLEAHDITLQRGCDVGLGAPSPQWTDVIEAGVTALSTLGAGRVEITDTAVRLIGAYGGNGAPFAEVEAAFAAALPELYTLTAVPPPQDIVDPPTQTKPLRFTALRSEDTAIRLRGMLTDETTRAAVRSYSQAQFGFDTVIDQTELNANLPEGWPRRVLSGIAALSLLHTGQLDVTTTSVSLTGIATTPEQQGRIAFFLESNLPQEIALALDIVVDETKAARAQGGQALYLNCASQINDLLTLARIEFSPGSADIAEESLDLIESVALILENCPGARFEIAGHTDSQGRETSNMALSQSRADAVVDALLATGLNAVYLSAVGYGESRPIADNSTEDGRAQNRRIAFSLLEAPESPDSAQAPNEATASLSPAEPAALDTPPTDETAASEDPQDGPPKLEEEARVTTTTAPLPRPEDLGTSAAPSDGQNDG